MTAALPRPAPALPAAFPWLAVLAASAALFLWGEDRLDWAMAPPRWLELPLAREISAFTTWLTREAALGPVRFQDLTRLIAALIALPYDAVAGLLTGPRALPWVSVAALAALLGLWAGGLRLAALAGAVFVLLALFGQWQSAMVTLASVLIAVPIGAALGLALGILAHRVPAFSAAIRPLLDLMQTMPVFAYLVPVLILFGFSPVSAIIATVIYAMPPMIRVTELALSRVPPEARELAVMTGCTPRQALWKVLLPSAREGLMVGVNQVIMLSLNMVIIASMIGAGGLGFDVLAALRSLDFDRGVAAGLAIVLIAVALDRISQAAAHPAAAGGGRHPRIGPLAGAAALAATGLLAWAVPALWTWPAGLTLSTGDWWARQIAALNVAHFDSIEAVKTWALVNLLVPVRRFLLEMPWLGLLALIVLAGWRLGGLRLALLAAALTLFVAATGLWEEAMITVYLCGVSTVVAMALGVPLGLLAAEVRPLWPPLRALVDTLQTLPSFVYLMPAVMLFRVGDFTAMLAVVAFAIAPAIRYTATGVMAVDPRLIEAARAMGATPLQILTRVKLRLALPEILLGLNQTLLAALAMLVITALVGTRDLGQEVYIALSRADAGRGLVAGLAIAAIAILADRLIQAAAGRARARLGLERRDP